MKRHNTVVGVLPPVLRGRPRTALRGAAPFEGGLPIIVDGKIIGAIGVSGATAVQDGQVAKAGAEALTK